LHAQLAELERFGIADGFELVDAGGLDDHVRVQGGQAALYSPHAAALHPGKLVRQLARAVERLGGRIAEGTAVTTVRERTARSRGSGAALVTSRGEVRAGTVVLAGEAYLTLLRPLHRALIPVWSQIVLSEPLPDTAWSEIGWQGHELIGSPRLTVVYLSRTDNGRILFGGRGAPYRYGSVIRESFGQHAVTSQRLRDTACEWFPTLRDVGFSHAWGGPLGMPRDWHPTISHDPARGIASARGYVGHGVATSNLAGRTLAELILERPSPRTELPLVGHRSRDWEPEPLRWLGVRFAQAALERADRRAARSGTPPSGRTLGERLARH
jgi:glycine/D-amino acid oxidase-like deaminating enzyme